MLPADKVVPKAGLVVCVYDILDIQGGFVYPSDGAAIYDVTFRLVVFLPFIGEVIVGRLASSSKWVPLDTMAATAASARTSIPLRKISLMLPGVSGSN